MKGPHTVTHPQPDVDESYESVLYLAVLPIVHYSKFFAGKQYEEVMTLVRDRNFSAEFSHGKSTGILKLSGTPRALS